MSAEIEYSVDEVGSVMISDLIAAKAKLDKLNKTTDKSRKIGIAFIIIFSFYTIIFTVIPFWGVYGSMIHHFLGDQLHLFLVLGSVIFLGKVEKVDKKYIDKADKKFQALRCEIITRSDELWPPEKINERQHAFRQLKEKYDINLYYES